MYASSSLNIYADVISDLVCAVKLCVLSSAVEGQYTYNPYKSSVHPDVRVRFDLISRHVGQPAKASTIQFQVTQGCNERGRSAGFLHCNVLPLPLINLPQERLTLVSNSSGFAHTKKKNCCDVWG